MPKLLGPRLTWDDLAELYDRNNIGRRARTLPMDTVYEWFEDHPEKFQIDKEGYMYQILGETKDA